MSEIVASEEIGLIKDRNFWALSISRLINGFGLTLITIIIQPFILDISNSIVFTGLMITLASIMQFLPMPAIGKLSDKFGRKSLLLLSIPIYVVGLCLLIISNSTIIYFLVLGVILFYFGFSINSLNTQFIISESTKGGLKGLTFAIMFFSFFVGSLGASSLIMFLEGADFRFFFVLSIPFILIEGIIYLLFINPESSKKEHIKKDSKKENKSSAVWKKTLKTKELRSILILFTVDLFVYGLSLSIYNGGLSDYYSLTKENIALLTFCYNIANMIFQLPMGRLADKVGAKKSLLLSQFFGLGFFIFNILTIFLWTQGLADIILITLIFGQISFAGSVTTFIPSERVILTDLDKENKAEIYGIVAFFRGIGFIPTGLIAGLLVASIHYVIPFMFSFIGVIFEIIYLVKFFHIKEK
ncbi:MAG: MFS transporter [Promethearchaeota archaeon]